MPSAALRWPTPRPARTELEELGEDLHDCISLQWGLEPAVHAFAESNQDLYEEIDRYGALAMERAKALARRASRLLGPYVPDESASDRSVARAAGCKAAGASVRPARAQGV